MQPMMWGLVPPWHHGSVASSHRLTTNNARLEGLGESKLYKPAIEHDRRCVVVCDAFYEWKKLKDAGTGKVFQSTVKLGNKERFNKDFIGIKEPFPVTSLPFTS